jgi:hypothetical protein
MKSFKKYITEAFDKPQKKKANSQISSEEEEKSKGFGDTVSKFINKATLGKVKECEPCKKRKKALNKVFPYKNK